MHALKGHAAVFTAYVIFGLNIVSCKDISNSGLLTPYALFLLRAGGATLLFWICSLFTKAEKVSRRDMPRILSASIIGLLIPQLTFLMGICQTAPIDSSLISSLSPVFTMLFAAWFLKEPITWMKVTGVAASLAGVTVLIFCSGKNTAVGTQTTLTGAALLFANCITFALYLGLFRPLIARYHVVTFMKWMFLYTLALSLPFCLKDTLQFAAAQPIEHIRIVWEIVYVVVGATFLSYLLLPIAQKVIRPTLVSMYSYLQPIVAMMVSIYIGMDCMTWTKGAAVVLIFIGLIIVTQSRRHTQPT